MSRILKRSQLVSFLADETFSGYRQMVYTQMKYRWFKYIQVYKETQDGTENGILIMLYSSGGGDTYFLDEQTWGKISFELLYHFLVGSISQLTTRVSQAWISYSPGTNSTDLTNTGGGRLKTF